MDGWEEAGGVMTGIILCGRLSKSTWVSYLPSHLSPQCSSPSAFSLLLKTPLKAHSIWQPSLTYLFHFSLAQASLLYSISYHTMLTQGGCLSPALLDSDGHLARVYCFISDSLTQGLLVVCPVSLSDSFEALLSSLRTARASGPF